MDPILENENQNSSENSRGSKSDKVRYKHKKKNETKQIGSQTVVGKSHKFLVTKLSTDGEKVDEATPNTSYSSNAHTVHFGTRGVESQRPHVRSIFEDKPTFPSTTTEESRAGNSVQDGASTSKEYETFHGTLETSPRSSIFDVFRVRRKSDSKKQGSLMQNVKAVFSKTTTAGPSSGQRSLEVPEIRKNGEKFDDSKHVSDKTYYNTVTGAPTRKTSTITRVMDIFKMKSSSESISATEANKKNKNQKGRRSSLGTTSPTYHKTSYASLDPLQAKQLFREVRGLPRYDPYLSIVQISLGGRDKTRVLLNFFKYHKCHELMPKSAKVIIFDTQFLVRKTFPTLISNGIRSAPLWDSTKKALVGMITATDFIRILLILFEEKNSMHDLETHTLHTWKKLLTQNLRPLTWIGPDQSLHEAINLLTEHRIHRLPIIDPYLGDVLYVLSHKRILRFLFVYLNEFPELTFFHSEISELKIGTYDNIITITDETSVKEAFDLMLCNTISALPIVDSNGKLLDVYAKCDVLNLVSEKLYLNMLITIKEVRQKKKDWQEKLQKCSPHITLYEALEIIVRTESHRILLVDSDDILVGIVSLSDMLVYLNRTIPSENKISALQELFKPLEENKFVESAKENEADTQSEGNTDDTPSSDVHKSAENVGVNDLGKIHELLPITKENTEKDDSYEAEKVADKHEDPMRVEDTDTTKDTEMEQMVNSVGDVSGNYSKEIVIGENSES